MPMDLSTYLVQLNDALQAENGANLAYLLRPASTHGKDLAKAFKSNAMLKSLPEYKGSIATPWDEIAIQYVLVCVHVSKRKSAEAFDKHKVLVINFFSYFGENRGWTLPALFSILRDLRDLAHDADVHAKYNNQKSERMEEAARIITKAFSSCLTDRTSPPNESRKWGIYYVVGLILKCYFRIRRISLSKNILRALEANTDIPPFHMFPRSHQVTFRYYIGMLSFLNEDYVKSESELTLAFYNCNLKAPANQERILAYLIPLRLVKGHLPSQELLNRFPNLRHLFSSFISAIRLGNLAGYDKAMEQWENRLVDLNLWFTMEKARDVCLRGLFRRVWVASDKASRIPISLFHCSLTMSGLEMPPEEAECLVANMIYKGFIRGYISHEKQMVVLANANAFPRLVDRQSPYTI